MGRDEALGTGQLRIRMKRSVGPLSPIKDSCALYDNVINGKKSSFAEIFDIFLSNGGCTIVFFLKVITKSDLR